MFFFWAYKTGSAPRPNKRNKVALPVVEKTEKSDLSWVVRTTAERLSPADILLDTTCFRITAMQKTQLLLP
jgi:hypothetical protein